MQNIREYTSKLSAITHGVFATGENMWGGKDKKDSIDSIHASLDHGMTNVDTVPLTDISLSEEVIGEAIIGKGKSRSNIPLLTKFSLVGDNSNGSKGEFFFDAEESEKRILVYKYASKPSIIIEVEESQTSQVNIHRQNKEQWNYWYN